MAQPTHPTSRSASALADRPFDPAVLRRAADLAAAYRITLRFEPDTGFVGECVAETRALVTSAVATTLEDGQVPPRPLDGLRA